MIQKTAPPAEQRFIMYGVTWDEYEGLLRAFADRRLRHTYDRGTLEIMSPSKRHEGAKTSLGDLVSVICRVLRIPRKGVGSMTMRREDLERGLEPDEGFYIGKKLVTLIRDRQEYDPYRDPPPNLMIEVDITRSSLKRLPIYKRLRVPEIWRYDGKAIIILVLDKRGNYKETDRSRLFPFLSAEDLSRFMAMRDTKDDTELEMAFEQWLRTTVAKRKGHNKLS